MTAAPEQETNWELVTWKGSRRQQHQEFYALPFARKLELIDEMAEMAAHLSQARKVSNHPSDSGTMRNASSSASK